MANTELDPAALERVAHLFGVLAESSRLAILQAIKPAPRTVTELVEKTALKQANVSKQLGILYAAGLVARERDGNLIRYSISDPMVFELCRLVCGKLLEDAKRELASFKRHKRG